MPGLDLRGVIDINAAPANRAAETLSRRLRSLSENSRASSKTIKETSTAMLSAARAAQAESAALAKLSAQQELNNKVRRESLATTRLTNAKAKAVGSDAEGRAAIAAGQRQLATNRALTETIRQRGIAEDVAGRSAVRSAQIASAANRDRIAQERLALSQQRAASADAARATNALRARSREAEESIRGVGTAATHAGVLGAAAFIGITANAVIMEKEFAKVVRTSSLIEATPKDLKGLGFKNQAEGIAVLRKQFDALANELPISYKELTEIGAAANQLGIRSQDLASFTKTVAQFSATTGVSVDTASTAFGRLNSLVTDTYNSAGKLVGQGVDNNFQALADSINRVGVTSVATDQQIIKISSQIAGIANAAGLGYEEIVGFSGALASVAVSPYLARGATTRLFTNIGNAVALGGEDLDKFAKVSGLTSQQFADDWENSPKSALIALFKGINSSGKDAVNVMRDLGIKSVLDQPALLRVAKFANQAGVAGEGLAEAFANANAEIAKGTNEEQYKKIAETVSARLQIAANRFQILFRNLGDSNLGPLGQAISTISAGALSLGQNLEKPVKLLGQFDLPITNGALLGFGIAATGAVAGALLLVGVLSKLYVGYKQVQRAALFVRGAISGSSVANAALAGTTTEAALATDRLAAAETRQAGAARASAAASAQASAAQARVSSARLATKMTPAAFPAAQAPAPRVFSVSSAGVATLKSTEKQAGLVSRALSGAGAAGTAAGSKIASGFRAAGGGISRAGSALSSFVGGPVGLIAVTALAGGAALEAIDASYRAVGSNAASAAVGIAKGNTALEIASNIKVGANSWTGILNADSKSFVTSTKSLKEGFENLGSGGAINDFLAKFNKFGAIGKEAYFNNFTTGLDKIDAGFRELADSGNVSGAVKGIQDLFKGQSDAAVTNGLAHMSNATAILQQALDQAGVHGKDLDGALLKLVRSNAILGESASKAAAQADYQARAFNGDTEAAATFSEATGKVIDQALDLNAAYTQASEGAGKAGAGFEAFIKQANSNYDDLINAHANAAQIAAATGADYEKLITLPGSVLSAAAKDVKGKGAELADALLLPEAAKNFETGIAAILNNPKLGALYNSLGPDLKKKLETSLKQGTEVGDAFADLGPELEAKYKAAVSGTQLDAKVQAKVDIDNIDLALGAIKNKIAGEDAVLKLSVNPGTAYKDGQSAADYISSLKPKFQILADNVPAVQAGESAEQYIARIQPQLKILGDNAPALKKGEDAASYMSRVKAQISILGDNLPAINKGESAKAYVNRLKGIMKVDANNAAALAKARAAAQFANSSKGTIQVAANTAAALGAINNAARPRSVSITAVANVAAASASIGALIARAASVHAATGGRISGPGTGTSDSIPARLSNGEYVIRAKQAKRFGSLLDNINYRGVAAYATGGRVTGGSARYNDTGVAQQSAYSGSEQRSRSLAPVVTELSAYDRHLLQNIANRVGFSIEPSHIAQATSTTYTKQSRRGNG